MGNTKMENKMDYKTIKNLIQNDEGIGVLQSALETWCPSVASTVSLWHWVETLYTAALASLIPGF